MTTAEFDAAFAGHKTDKGIERVQTRFGLLPNPEDRLDSRALQYVCPGAPVRLDETSGVSIRCVLELLDFALGVVELLEN
jgi:hypothetical protein